MNFKEKNNNKIDFINELKYLNEKKNLVNEINEWLYMTEFKKKKNLIIDELNKKNNLFLYEKEYYRNLIFFTKSENVLDEIDLEIIFCNGNKELTDIWKYFKIMSSSAVTGDSGFGCIKIMIKDKNSQKYLGILEISNDIYSCQCRDDFIGWNSSNKKDIVNINENLQKSRISYIINITCCIGLQPMSYNLNIGKLLVMTIFSNEVMEYFKEKRGYYYTGVSTFGLYGKSIQYDRLKEIKFIGETKGNGTCEFPQSIYENLRDFIKQHYPNEYIKRSNMSSSKMRILQFSLNILDFDYKNILFHGKKRGIYFGSTSNQSIDFLNGKTNNFNLDKNIRNFKSIVNYWKQRWAKNRLLNLMNNNRFKIAYELKDFSNKEKKNEYSKQYQYEKLNDEIWLKHKKEKSIIYYQNNKDNILKELKINLDNYRNNNFYIHSEYLAGFFDSDGSIYISKNILFIGFTQCVINILLLIQQKYGGTLFKRESVKKNQRDQYTLRFVGLDCKKILYDLVNFCILKFNKVSKGIELLDFINKKDCNEKRDIIDFLSNNKKEDNIQLINRINWKYLSGFFDGDGYIGLNYRYLDSTNCILPKLSICQKYTPHFLNSIKIFFEKECNNNFSISKIEVTTSKKDNIIKIYNNIKNYIIVKKYQFDTMIRLFNEYNKSNKDLEQINFLAFEIKNNKHQNINYELNIEDNNIISTMKNNVLNNIEKEIQNELHKETNTKIIQSEKKKGLNNPNYGHHLDDEHALNISISTTNAKRANNPKLSNENIREIYELKDTGILQKDIAEKYNMNRELIRKIWNKSILPTDDPEFINSKKELVKSNKNNENDNITFEQKTSIGKRNLNIDEYIEIILWKEKHKNGEKLEDKKIFSTNLSLYLSKKWDKKVTNDIVKNLWSERTKLFEFEFKDKSLSYEKYMEIIEK